MKKSWIVVGMLSIGYTHAQVDKEYDGRVGINTRTPHSSLEIARHTNLPETSPQGVLFPRLSTAQRDQFTLEQAKHEGMMIYNTDNKCLEMYTGVVSGVHQWNCISGGASSQSHNVSISPAGFEGTYVYVGSTDEKKVKFKLKNNSFFTINNVDFSTAVSISNPPANITIPAGQNNNVTLNGGQEVTLSYTMTGDMERGTLTANFNHLGLTATQSVQVTYGKATINNVKVYVASSTNLTEGKIGNYNPYIVDVKIPYTNGVGVYDRYTNIQTTAVGENGDVENLRLTINGGGFENSGEIDATINVVDSGEYLVKKLAPGQQETIAVFPVNLDGTEFNVELIAIGGIPDRNFNTLTDGRYKHRFLYIPIEVTGANGYRKIWLNNNLGAEYADLNNPRGNFNPTKQATAHNDHLAFGSLFQWQRPADGHELVKWTNPNTIVYTPTTDVVANNPNWIAGHSNFIIRNPRYPAYFYADVVVYPWVHPDIFLTHPSSPLWKVNGANNPCPVGYHIPTKEEWQELYTALGNNISWANTGNLKLPSTGWRTNDRNDLVRERIHYWSSTGDTEIDHEDFVFRSIYYITASGLEISLYPSNGSALRCIKD